MEKSLENYFINLANKSENSSIYTKGNLNFKERIDNIIQGYEGKMTKILERLEKNLFLFKDNDEEENIFGNYTSYFQAGILLQKILTQNYIILKRIDSLSPNILERFNDLLNYSPKLILNEDLYNTFTEENKEIKNFSDNFRIIGISSFENINNFSEASKSRFTIISTSKYYRDEKIILIKQICPNCPVNFNKFLDKFLTNI